MLKKAVSGNRQGYSRFLCHNKKKKKKEKEKETEKETEKEEVANRTLFTDVAFSDVLLMSFWKVRAEYFDDCDRR